jgi:hypothetical protein
MEEITDAFIIVKKTAHPNPPHGNLEFFAAHLSVINARLLAKLHTYQLLLRGMVFKNNFDLSDSLFSLRLSGFIFRSGNFLPDPYFYTPPNRIK